MLYGSRERRGGLETCHLQVVELVCVDRFALLFDTVCTITDCGYDIFHGRVGTRKSTAYPWLTLAEQMYYLRHTEGEPRETEHDRSVLELQLADAIEVFEQEATTRDPFEGFTMIEVQS